jgi:1,4-dihydroxy-2-naphthoate octaprenyltransferase
LLDVMAIVLGYLMLNLTFAVMVFIYGLISKAYSHPSVRLKKHAFLSLAVTGLFQGLFTFMMCYIGINNFDFGQSLKIHVLMPGFLTTLMLWANYPMTQIYQHDEDRSRGDITASIRFGIIGTFYFTASVFGLAVIGFLFYFRMYTQEKHALIFLAAVLPVLAYFFYWFVQVMKNRQKADYEHTMLLNYFSATCLNLFFLYLFLDITQLTQYLNG